MGRGEAEEARHAGPGGGDRRLPEAGGPGCRVCGARAGTLARSELVADVIDRGLLAARSPARISREVRPLMEAWPESGRISDDAIRRHGWNHLGLEAGGSRGPMELQAQERVRKPEGAEGVPPEGVAVHMAAEMANQRLVSGEVQARSYTDLLQANRLSAEFRAQESGRSTMLAWQREAQALLMAIRDVVPMSMLEAIDEKRRAYLGGGGAGESMSVVDVVEVVEAEVRGEVGRDRVDP